MIIVMKPHASSDHIQEVKHFIENNGLTAHLSQGEEVTIIGVVGDKKETHRQKPGASPRRGPYRPGNRKL